MGNLNGHGADAVVHEAVAAHILVRFVVDVELLRVVQLVVVAQVEQGEVDGAPTLLKGVKLDHIQVLPALRGGGVDRIAALREFAAVGQLAAALQITEVLAGRPGLAGQVIIHEIGRDGDGHKPQGQGQGEHKAQDPARKEARLSHESTS